MTNQVRIQTSNPLVAFIGMVGGVITIALILTAVAMSGAGLCIFLIGCSLSDSWDTYRRSKERAKRIKEEGRKVP